MSCVWKVRKYKMQMIKVEIVKEEEEIYFKIEVSGDKYLFEKTEDLLRFAEQNNLHVVF